jgi:hypothetical protein
MLLLLEAEDVRARFGAGLFGQPQPLLRIRQLQLYSSHRPIPVQLQLLPQPPL